MKVFISGIAIICFSAIITDYNDAFAQYSGIKTGKTGTPLNKIWTQVKTSFNQLRFGWAKWSIKRNVNQTIKAFGPSIPYRNNTWIAEISGAYPVEYIGISTPFMKQFSKTANKILSAKKFATRHNLKNSAILGTWAKKIYDLNWPYSLATGKISISGDNLNTPKSVHILKEYSYQKEFFLPAVHKLEAQFSLEPQ